MKPGGSGGLCPGLGRQGRSGGQHPPPPASCCSWAGPVSESLEVTGRATETFPWVLQRWRAWREGQGRQYPHQGSQGHPRTLAPPMTGFPHPCSSGPCPFADSCEHWECRLPAHRWGSRGPGGSARSPLGPPGLGLGSPNCGHTTNGCCGSVGGGRAGFRNRASSLSGHEKVLALAACVGCQDSCQVTLSSLEPHLAESEWKSGSR